MRKGQLSGKTASVWSILDGRSDVELVATGGEIYRFGDQLKVIQGVVPAVVQKVGSEKTYPVKVSFDGNKVIIMPSVPGRFIPPIRHFRIPSYVGSWSFHAAPRAS